MKHYHRHLVCRIVCYLLTGFGLISPVWAADLKFSLFGDVYMTDMHPGYLKGMLADMAEQQTDLGIFTGGIKPAAQDCQDRNLLADYPVLANAPLPTFYVPGDAEWLLCKQASSGNFDPQERLALLRATFYKNNRSLGNPDLPLSRQPSYPEHMRWTAGPALFVTTTVENDPTLFSGKPAHAATVPSQQTEAATAWLKEAFDQANLLQLGTLVIITHGDPALETATDTGLETGKQLNGTFLNVLRDEASKFRGQILFVHGGNGVHRIDHPLIDQENQLPMQNFTRVETYGALQQGWVQVQIEKNRFRFESFPWPPLTLQTESADENIETSGSPNH